MSELDKNIAKFLVRINSKKKANIPKLPIEVLRETYEKFCLSNSGPLIRIERIEDKDIIINDNYSVPIRIYTPKIGKTLAVVIYFHGGSWSFGNHTTHDVICRNLSIGSESIVIAVDWRKSPENQFPAPIEDCLNVFNWVKENYSSISGDRNNIIFAGDSAGGNVVSASLVRLNSLGEEMPKAQFLIYPALDLNFSSESTSKYSQGYFINSEFSRIFVSKYAPNISLDNPELSPLYAENFRNFPKALLIAAEFDPLSDDTRKYEKKLKEAKIPVEAIIYPGMIHDFLHLIAISPEAKRIMGEICSKLKNLIYG